MPDMVEICWIVGERDVSMAAVGLLAMMNSWEVRES
jgi:hypothetical protein